MDVQMHERADLGNIKRRCCLEQADRVASVGGWVIVPNWYPAEPLAGGVAWTLGQK